MISWCLEAVVALDLKTAFGAGGAPKPATVFRTKTLDFGFLCRGAGCRPSIAY